MDTTFGPDSLLLSRAAEPGMIMLGPIYAISKCDSTNGRYVPNIQLKFLKLMVNITVLFIYTIYGFVSI